MNDFSFADIFTLSMSPLRVLITLLLALAVGGFICFIYKRTFGGVMYSRNFNLSLIVLTMVTSLMLMLINNSLALSMGMVGALSIIRFRTAIKDPMDTVFMFWSVGEGIALGTKFYDIAVISAIVIGVVLAAMGAFKFKGTRPYILIIHYDEAASAQIKQMIKQLPSPRLKSKTVQRDGIELTMELRLKDNETGFVEKFLRVDGVYDAALISHQGDIVS
ncbi:MAG: DUF4956 domain-containing protein [Eubacteriales bacterium]|jgi:uncharacterized membrane protein YhiD involved in acid resistance|nr:DUF4956 domain-containing protein [Eubacteriales bacterium]MCI6979860.1 DUF4956 domain-containing protein [Clostridiales bacterium]MDD6721794.1 DUF4956 domain-containing protein [Clostridiales bacterium]MDY5694618.1 DUF4956 domain-containing protein [Eubacteriales bacterium]HZK45947.1 DUF4956 domain-containing protein [Clostridia bacterium]